MARICIDGFNLSMPKGSGIATYARSLHQAQRQLGHETQILYSVAKGLESENLLNEVALFDATPPGGEKRGRLEMLRRLVSAPNPIAAPVTMTGAVILKEMASRFPAPDRVWACRDVFHAANRAYAMYQRATPLRLGLDVQTDVMHWTCALPMYEPRIPNLYTIHDMVPLRLPFATLDNKRNFLTMCRMIAERAAKILTVSEHSRRDIIRFLGVSEDKVVNTYQPVEMPAEQFSRPDDDVSDELESVFNLSWRGYYIYFGAIEPKKNLARIVEAYLASGVKRPLVIVGGQAWLDEDQTGMLYDDIVQGATLREGVLRRADRIRQYEFLPRRLLASLVRGARATLFPSLYEGFGLPAMESMLLGTPVLTSLEGCMPEIAGDAALMVDPYDAQAIRKAIVALDVDQDLCDDLAARGRLQAARYDAAAFRSKLDEVYRAVA